MSVLAHSNELSLGLDETALISVIVVAVVFEVSVRVRS